MKFTILKRLIFGYAVIMLLIVFLGVYITLQLNKLNRFVREISSVDGITIGLTERLSDKLFSQVGFDKKYLISQDQDFFHKFWEIKKHLTQDMERLESMMITKGDKKVFFEAKQFYHVNLHSSGHNEVFPKFLLLFTKDFIVRIAED